MRRKHHKGDRAQIAVLGPPAHKRIYEARAKSCRLNLNDYIALVLARSHSLSDPFYIRADVVWKRETARVQISEQLEMFGTPATPDYLHMPFHEREAWPVRVPAEHKAIYKQLAAAAELPVAHYIVLAMARAHGIPDPAPRFSERPAGSSAGGKSAAA